MKTAFGKTQLIASAALPRVGETFAVQALQRVYQVTLSGTAATAQVAIEVSADNVSFQTLATVDVAAQGGLVSDGFANNAAWPFVRANVLSITGDGIVDVILGV